MNFKELLEKRILILDGAMGTMIQRYNLTEEDYRGTQFAHLDIEVKGNNDLLSLTRPDVIGEIHEAYLQAGADIIETNTFSTTTVSMADYHVEGYVEEMNRASVKLARSLADKYTALTPNKPRFVAGSVGPTNKTCSMSPDVNDPAYRALTFDELATAYREQMVVLITEGIDVLLIETIFDTLNAKAALVAAVEAMTVCQREIPIMLSVTLSDAGGRTLSGQTLGAFLASVQHAPIVSVGLNCSFGARDMKPFLRQLAATAPYYVSAYPNAGLPNRFGKYDETPEKMAVQIKEYIDEGLVNILGGCCGTTPQHIAAYLPLIEGATVRRPVAKPDALWLSGLELLEVKPENNFINVGERCNVAGSRKFLRLINEKKYDEALDIARKQVEDGAQVIDINMDDAMLDAKEEMTHFLNLLAAEPDICKVPIMIDSSKWEVIKAGLKCVQGKCIVNSISLKEGEEEFLAHAREIKLLGAAVVVMAFDEQGQADSFERKTAICQRAYHLLVNEVDFNPHDIIFDPNILAIATGIEEHRNYGVDFIKSVEWIKANLPHAKVSGGVSNLSFAMRGNNYIREAMHAVFLYHAIAKGMDMGIVNPATTVTYNELSPEVIAVIERAVLNTSSDATEQLIELATQLREQGVTVNETIATASMQLTVEERLIEALMRGRSEQLEQDLDKAMTHYQSAITIIEKVLMEGMKRVGSLFGEGKMFLPQVVKTARIMKQAVAHLQPYIEEANQGASGAKAGKFLLATVKGDVHDIGKNIVSVILACNNFEVIDLGVMVHAEEIVKRAQAEQVDFVGLSGLITPSLEEMCHVADEMERAGLTIPLMIGGATTSKLHTAVKIAPRYSGVVVHVKDAAQNPVIATQLMNPATRDSYIAEVHDEQERLRQSIDKETTRLCSFEQAKQNALQLAWENYSSPTPRVAVGKPFNLRYSITEVVPFIDWKAFFNTWKLGGMSNIASIKGCDHCVASWLASFPTEERGKASEAMQLYKEAQRMLEMLATEVDIYTQARYALFEATSSQQCIVVKHPQGEHSLPCLRQQVEKNDNCYLALSDFVAPSSLGKKDHVATFAVTVSLTIEEKIAHYQQQGDSYKALLLQSLASRLAEATAELLHYQMRTNYWGYTPDELLDIEHIIKRGYQGIRPAIGYPSLPDQSLNFDLEQLLGMSEIGITLTDNGAMYPSASISGIMLAHPEARYFYIGAIDTEQRAWYISQRPFAAKEDKKWLAL